MKIACKTNNVNTLTQDKIYDVIKGSWEEGRFFIKDDFENEQWYFYEYFYTLEEMRDIKIKSLLRDSRLEDLGI
jgi:hypothetical protein